MYNSPPPGTGIAGLGIGTGTLAVTGFSSVALGMVAALLIVLGLILLRIAMLRRDADDQRSLPTAA